jgi:disulfide bond formation protein DsbB
MRNQIDNWLAGDWVVLGTNVQHWVLVLAAIVLVALLVAWFERPRRAPGRRVSAQS